LQVCESRMYSRAQQDSGMIKPTKLGTQSGVAFVRCMFGREFQLDSTEKLMASIRLWVMRFEANVDPLLKSVSSEYR
jgi:hypothetical protein